MGKLTKATHNMAQEQFNLNWHTYSDHLKEMMQNLMQSNESTDVTLLCEDKTRFKAHKFVLKACSPVFQSIIDDMPQNEGSVVYLRGVLAPEMKSILQFMYLGQATLYQDQMNEFLDVAKSLEIKEISKDVECDQAASAYNQECDAMMNGNRNEIETIENLSTVAEDQEQIESKVTSYRNESEQYPCNKCDKKFSWRLSLNRHIKSAHEGLKYPCNDCDYKATQRGDLSKHIQAVHEGQKFPCNFCEYEAT